MGGGVFGISAAILLAEDGHRVDLFERHHSLLSEASGINQYRLHRGYHYPRSLETALSSKEAEAEFMRLYGEATIAGDLHYYAIASRGSLTSAEDFHVFCRELGLFAEPDRPRFIKPESVATCVRVQESLIHPSRLRDLSEALLRSSGVRVHLDTSAHAETFDDHDFVVIATYALLNELVVPLGGAPQTYQFEVCEKPVIRLPQEFQGHSVVIMDGPFTCIDPLGGSDLFVIGNVVHALHHTNVGLKPEVPDELVPLLNRGIISDPPITRFDRFVETAQHFFEGAEKAEHIGSMFTIRTVLPYVEATDARPTMITPISDRAAAIFSGKIGTCVTAGVELRDRLRRGPPV